MGLWRSFISVTGMKFPIWTQDKIRPAYQARGPFLEGHETFSHPESHSKISKLMITELFYSRSFNMNRGSLHRRSFRRVHLFVFKYRLTQNGFTGPKSFRGFRETGPSPVTEFIWRGPVAKTIRIGSGRGIYVKELEILQKFAWITKFHFLMINIQYQ